MIVSIVIPVYNEAGNIIPVYERTLEVLRGLNVDYEFIFTDNHSTDTSFQDLRQLAERDNRVRVIRFSKNFGFQKSILTGYLAASGDVAIQLDCDLQDPPELIPEFLARWRDGFRVVNGVRRSRPEGWWISTARKLFYRLINLLSEEDLPLDVGDFRLVDRCVLEELRLIDDQQPYLRGTIALFGFAQCGVAYDRAGRARGESKFPLHKLIGLAVDGILNHSLIPLRIATGTGIFMSALAVFGGLGYLVGKIYFGMDWPPGFATTVLLLMLGIGLNSFFLGIIGEFVGRIYRQVKRRPLVVVECELNRKSSGSGTERVGPRPQGAESES